MSRLKKIVRQFIGECWHAEANEKCILETLSENCLHQKTIGKCVGIDSFITDCRDWSRAFPDYGTRIEKIEQYKNVVVCDILRTGTHQEVYKSTNRDKKSILIMSDFFMGIENAKSSGISYGQPAKVIFSFEKEKITFISIEEDPVKMCLELKIPFSSRKQGEAPQVNSAIDFAIASLKATFDTTLTRREMECLSLGFCGFSAKHIGEILKISYRTVEFFLLNAYRKLDCSGKQEALEKMYEKQLLSLWLDLGKQLVRK